MEIYHGRPKYDDGRLEKELKVYDLLDELGISICKNLFLCNRQKTAYYLLLLPGYKALKTKELSKQIPTSRLSFASGEDMEEYLNVTPGSATIMGLMFDPENRVQLVIDEELLKEEWFGCHPCINTSSLKLRTEDVIGKYLQAVHHEYLTVNLSDGNQI